MMLGYSEGLEKYGEHVEGAKSAPPIIFIGWGSHTLTGMDVGNSLGDCPGLPMTDMWEIRLVPLPHSETIYGRNLCS